MSKVDSNSGYSIKDLSKIYYSEETDTKTLVLRGLSFELPEPTFVSIFGPSGSGKSTLLRIMGGVEVPTTGLVKFDNHIITNLKGFKLVNYIKSNISFIYQDINQNFIPYISIKENAKLIYNLRNDKKQPFNTMLTNFLEKLQLKTVFLDSNPQFLSGGEKQKVSILLALISGVRIILADEPTGNLHSEATEDIWSTFKELSEDNGLWSIVVSHDKSILNYSAKNFNLQKGLFTS